MLGKIFEKFLNSRIVNLITKHALISPRQFGFQKGISTETAVMDLVEQLYDSMNLKKCTVNIFVDLQKAYDTVNRGILLQKLDRYGVRGPVLQLIASFLSNRKQRVRCGAAKSSEATVLTGLPTGSVLSCILFLIYINDLPDLSSHFVTTVYADDTTLSIAGSDVSEITIVGNDELNIFLDWTRANRLSVNSLKTFMIPVSLRSEVFPNILLDGTYVECLSHGKFLGVILDSKLKFNFHIKEVCSKISKAIGVIYSLKNYLGVQSLVSLYFSLILPHLSYCLLVWGSASDSLLKPLELLQKRCVRLITKSPFLAHTDPLFKQYKILKIRDLYKFRLAILAFGKRSELRDVFGRSHSHSTRNRDTLLPEFQRLSLTQKSIAFQLPSLWNNIPDDIKTSPTLSRFKTLYRDYLLSSYNSLE